jgi:hypothetical protein
MITSTEDDCLLNEAIICTFTPAMHWVRPRSDAQIKPVCQEEEIHRHIYMPRAIRHLAVPVPAAVDAGKDDPDCDIAIARLRSDAAFRFCGAGSMEAGALEIYSRHLFNVLMMHCIRLRAPHSAGGYAA